MNSHHYRFVRSVRRAVVCRALFYLSVCEIWKRTSVGFSHHSFSRVVISVRLYSAAATAGEISRRKVVPSKQIDRGVGQIDSGAVRSREPTRTGRESARTEMKSRQRRREMKPCQRRRGCEELPALDHPQCWSNECRYETEPRFQSVDVRLCRDALTPTPLYRFVSANRREEVRVSVSFHRLDERAFSLVSVFYLAYPTLAY